MLSKFEIKTGTTGLLLKWTKIMCEDLIYKLKSYITWMEEILST